MKGRKNTRSPDHALRVHVQSPRGDLPLTFKTKTKQQQANAHAKINFMKPGEWRDRKWRREKSDVEMQMNMKALRYILDDPSNRSTWLGLAWLGSCFKYSRASYDCSSFEAVFILFSFLSAVTSQSVRGRGRERALWTVCFYFHSKLFAWCTRIKYWYKINSEQSLWVNSKLKNGPLLGTLEMKDKKTNTK